MTDTPNLLRRKRRHEAMLEQGMHSGSTDAKFDPPPAPEITRDDLGHLGGNARFHPPSPDRSQQIAQGQRPTARSSALYWWGWSW